MASCMLSGTCVQSPYMARPWTSYPSRRHQDLQENNLAANKSCSMTVLDRLRGHFLAPREWSMGPAYYADLGVILPTSAMRLVIKTG